MDTPRYAAGAMVHSIEDALRAHRVRLVAKRDSRLMDVLAWLLRPLGARDFLSHFWTTIGRTIYYPTRVADPFAHPDVLEHELVHVRQWQRWGVLFWISYVLLPLPFGLAWFRFRWEREAYLVQLARATDRDREIARIVDALWFGYARPWPRSWMRRWFERKARELVPGTRV
jgi:hypothetical protein